MTRRSTTSRSASEWGHRTSSPEAPSSPQLDYFLARELFRRVHRVPSLRELPRFGRSGRRVAEAGSSGDPSRPSRIRRE
jgi:hypothetical protein